MKLNQLLKEIKETCKLCQKCDPSCTGNMIKKYIENKESISKVA